MDTKNAIANLIQTILGLLLNASDVAATTTGLIMGVENINVVAI
jgi:hypothetical protein